MSTSMPRKNQVGPFVLGRTLGIGSTGKVRIGIHTETGSKVAVKIIKKELLMSRPGMQKKIQREISVMKLIVHPNVVRLYDVYETPRHLYLVLEYVEGGELFEYLVKKRVLEEDEALRVFQHIIAGLDYCHKHFICHRDLKPENLLLDKTGRLKIADFGMASFSRPAELQATSCGSPHYAAPEVVRGDKYVGAQADVWSAGVILYALLTGRLPFDDENMPKLLQKVKLGVFDMPSVLSPDAQHLIFRMLTLDPARRITITEIRKHRFFRKNSIDPESVIFASAPTEMLAPFKSSAQINAEYVQTMKSLGWDSEEEITAALMSNEPNLERVLYRLLQTRETQKNEEFQLFSRGHKWKGRLQSEVVGSRARSSSMETNRLEFLARLQKASTPVTCAPPPAHPLVSHERQSGSMISQASEESTPTTRSRSNSIASVDSEKLPARRSSVTSQDEKGGMVRAVLSIAHSKRSPKDTLPELAAHSPSLLPQVSTPSRETRAQPMGKNTPSSPQLIPLRHQQSPSSLRSLLPPESPKLAPIRMGRPDVSDRSRLPPRVSPPQVYHIRDGAALLRDPITPSSSPKVSWFGHVVSERRAHARSPSPPAWRGEQN